MYKKMKLCLVATLLLAGLVGCSNDNKKMNDKEMTNMDHSKMNMNKKKK